MIEKNKDKSLNKKDKEAVVVNETIKKEDNFSKVYLKSIRVSPKKLNIIISQLEA